MINFAFEHCMNIFKKKIKNLKANFQKIALAHPFNCTVTLFYHIL